MTGSASTSANGTLDVLVDAAEFEARKAGFEPLPPRYTTGVLAKYIKLVGSAAGRRGLRLAFAYCHWGAGLSAGVSEIGSQ